MNEGDLIKELKFKAIRSSGSGGQHINKVASKVELQFNIHESNYFSEEQKERLTNKLKAKLSKEGVLVLQCGETRSQHKNKQIVINRFLNIISEALKVNILRKPTKVPKHIKIKRLKSKRQQAEKKINRKPPEIS